MSKEKESNGMPPVLRICLLNIIEEMLNSKGDGGAYDTGQCVDRIEDVLRYLVVEPEVFHLTGSEAIWGFVGWLSHMNDVPPLGDEHEDTRWPKLINQFIEHNGLRSPRSGWTDLMEPHPTELDG